VSSNLLWFSSPVFSAFCLLFCIYFRLCFVPPPLLFLVYYVASLCLNIYPVEPFFSLLYSGLFTPQLARRKFPSLLRIPFLFEYYGTDLRQKTCEFKDLYFWKNYRKSNLLSNNIDLAIFGPLRLEIWVVTRDSIWSAGSSGLIQSLFFDSLFGLRNSKTEFSTLHMFCRPSSQIFKNGNEHLELNCIASFAAQNQSIFGFTAGFCLLSNLVFENTLISHEVNSSKKEPKF